MAEPSKPMPSAKAPSSSAGAIATDFRNPSTSVNQSRMKRMSRSSSVRRTNSCWRSNASPRPEVTEEREEQEEREERAENSDRSKNERRTETGLVPYSLPFACFGHVTTAPPSNAEISNQDPHHRVPP